MINLRRLKEGGAVKFRNKGEATLSHVILGIQLNELCFVEFPELIFEYDDLGSYGDNHPLDIIEIIPAPFDWGTVKAGDEFNFLEDDGGSNVFYYIGDTLHNSDYKIFSEDLYCNNMHVLNILDEGYKLTPKENNND